MTPELGDIVRIVFWDHAQDSDNALRFEVFGRVSKIDKRCIVVHCWRYVDDIDRAKDHNLRHNEDRFAIVRKAIETIDVYEQ